MSSEETTPKGFGRATRVPLESVVRLHFEGEVSYQNGFSANLSATGMFVKHPEPHPIGSRLVFECLIGQKRQPVQGSGQVVWVRPRYEGPGLPAGMGIEFLDLDNQSRDHLTEALFEYLEESLSGLVFAGETEEEIVPEATESPGGGGEVLAAPSAAPEMEVWEAPSTPPEAFHPEAGEPAPAFLAAEPFPPPPAPVSAESLATPAAPVWLPDAAVAPPFEEPAAAWSETEDDYGLTPATGHRRPWLWGALAAGVVIAAAAGWFWWPRPAGTPAAPAAAVAEDAAQPAPAPVAERAVAEPVAEPATADSAAAVAAAAPSSPAPPPAAAPTVRFGGVSDLRWEASAAGTELAVLLDGGIATGEWMFAAMPGENPRLLIKLRGVTRPFRPQRVEVDTPEVRAVRFGLHAGAQGNEQHLVLDLGSCDPRHATVEAAGDRLLVHCPAG